MADSLINIQQIVAGSGADTRLNELFDALLSAICYGRNAQTSTGLTFGFYGGRFNGNAVANGTVSLTASSTNYVVALKSTGAVSTSTATTNWNDKATYARLYQVVTGTSTVTTYTSHRDFYSSVTGSFVPLAQRDASGGYVGLTVYNHNFKNVAGTFTSFFTNTNTAARTYTFQDKTGTIADLADLALKADLASPALTGTPTAPTAAAGTNTTQLATTAHVFAERTNTATLTNKTADALTLTGITTQGTVGTFATRFGSSDVTPEFAMKGTSSGGSSFANMRFTGTANGPTNFFVKSRGAANANDLVQSGDLLGHISWGGTDGAKVVEGARITAMVDGTAALSSMPTAMILYTNSGSGATPIERLRIDSTGQLIHRANATTIVDANSHLGLRSYTVATVPSAATVARLIYVSDGTSNKRLAVSDGTNWRWPDGAIVS